MSDTQNHTEAGPSTEQNVTPPDSFNNELKGALFQNDKGDNPARPDYRGRCLIDGHNYKISGWKRAAKSDGRIFLSLAFTEDVAANDTSF